MGLILMPRPLCGYDYSRNDSCLLQVITLFRFLVEAVIRDVTMVIMVLTIMIMKVTYLIIEVTFAFISFSL